LIARSQNEKINKKYVREKWRHQMLIVVLP